MKKVFVWNGSDLDCILIQGDFVNKSLGENDLSLGDLSRSVIICDNHAPLAFLKLETKNAHLAAGEPLLRSIVRSNNEHMFVLFLTKISTAALQDNNFFTSLTRIVEICMACMLSCVFMSCKDFQFINVEIRKTASFNILSHY